MLIIRKSDKDYGFNPIDIIFPNIVVIALALILVSVLTFNVLTDNVGIFNTFVAEFVQSFITNFNTKFMIFVSSISNWYSYIPICLFLLAFKKTRFKIGIPVSVMLSISALSNTILKYIFVIPRPSVNRLVEASGYGYPSGHSMNTMVFIGTLLAIFLIHNKGTTPRVIASILCVLFILLVGTSRIYLGVHNPTDVIAGYLFGIIIINCGLIFYKLSNYD